MNVVVTGATGFIGTRLTQLLREKGYQVEGVDPRQSGWENKVETADAVVNLAGSPLFGKRWTTLIKSELHDSRVSATRKIVEAMGRGQKKDPKPRVLVSGSAIGFYGATDDEVLNETSAAGHDFLAFVCREWEAEAEKAHLHYGIRTVLLRTGIVLGKGGGALKQMLPPFKLGLGGPIGNGQQWMSWIQLDDICNLIIHAITHDAVKGALNATAPTPARNKDFTKTLGAVIGRPTFLPIPSIGLYLAFGESAHILSTGQKVMPEQALATGFRFKYAALNEALSASIK
ncbi:MAG: TIGR01777 family oxidoreductase [Bdellovibrionota bacterium]